MLRNDKRSVIASKAKQSQKEETSKRLLRHFRLLHYIRNDIPHNDEGCMLRNDKKGVMCTNHMNENNLYHSIEFNDII